MDQTALQGSDELRGNLPAPPKARRELNILTLVLPSAAERPKLSFYRISIIFLEEVH